MTDLNLAGIGTLSFLILFFPVIGLFERRRQKVAERRAMQKLIMRESERIVAETERQYERGVWRP